MDQKEQLYNLYLKNNLITDKVTLKMWNTMSPRQQKEIYNIGKNKGLFQKVQLEQSLETNRTTLLKVLGAIDVLEQIESQSDEETTAEVE